MTMHKSHQEWFKTATVFLRSENSAIRPKAGWQAGSADTCGNKRERRCERARASGEWQWCPSLAAGSCGWCPREWGHPGYHLLPKEPPRQKRPAICDSQITEFATTTVLLGLLDCDDRSFRVISFFDDEIVILQTKQSLKRGNSE